MLIFFVPHPLCCVAVLYGRHAQDRGYGGRYSPYCALKDAFKFLILLYILHPETGEVKSGEGSSERSRVDLLHGTQKAGKLTCVFYICLLLCSAAHLAGHLPLVLEEDRDSLTDFAQRLRRKLRSKCCRWCAKLYY